MSEELIGAEYRSDVPRRWNKIDGGIKLGPDRSESWSETDAGEALNLLLPSEDYDVFAVHLYEVAGKVSEKPSEIILSSRDDEEYAMEAFSIQEESMTTERTKDRFNDRIDDLNVLHQAIQGESHGYAHQTNRQDKNKLTVGELNGFIGDIFKGKDSYEWVKDSDTGSFTSKMDPNPVDYYRMAPRSEIIFEDPTLSDEIGIFMDNYRDFIDVIVEDYEFEHKGWEDVIMRNYTSLSEHVEGFSSKAVENILQSFPDQMEKLMNEKSEYRLIEDL